MGIKGLYLFLAFTFFGGMSLWAQPDNHFIHKVKEGETLYSISRQYEVTIDDIAKFNERLNKLELKVGDVLLIPNEKVLRAGRDPRKAPLDTTNFIYYEVEPGQTLFSLAKRYAITIEQLKEYNPILRTEGLKQGFLLRIPRNRAEEARERLDPNFHWHVVQEEETAYSISRTYRVSLDSLYVLNPEAQNGLQLGQLLRFPKDRYKYGPEEQERLRQLREDQEKRRIAARKKAEERERLGLDEKPKEEEPPTGVFSAKGESKYFLYKIKAGDTFYGLKERYQVSQEELVKVNPELSEGLIVGKYIIIPRKEGAKEFGKLDEVLGKVNEEEDLSSETVANKARLNAPRDSSEQSEGPRDSLSVDTNREYRVLILLPFRSNLYHDSLDVYNYQPHRETVMANQFYLGFKSAADSLVKAGMKLTLKVLDTKGDRNEIRSILSSIRAFAPDLVVGPARSANVEYLADELAADRIPVVSPLSRSVKVEGRPNLIQTIPGEASFSAAVSEFLNQHYPNAHVLFAHCGKREDEDKLRAIQARLNPREDQFISSVLSCDELSKRNTLGQDFNLDGTKVVVLINDDRVFLSDVIGKLNGLRDTSIVLIGHSSILQIPTMELSYLNNLKFTTFQVRNTNYSDTATKKLIQAFRERNGADAGPFALQGFDAGMYFLSSLQESGTYFMEYLEYKAARQVSTGYRFLKVPDGGYRNEFLFTAGVRNFELVRVSK